MRMMANIHKSLRDVLFDTILFIWIFVTSGPSFLDSYYVIVIENTLIIKIRENHRCICIEK